MRGASATHLPRRGPSSSAFAPRGGCTCGAQRAPCPACAASPESARVAGVSPPASLGALFAHDFSRVRVHADAAASHEAAARDAVAVTEGSDIYFARGAYAPDTSLGRAVLAHELTHVVQGQSSRPRAAEPALEAEALRAGARAAQGRTVSVAHGGDARPRALSRTAATLLGLGIGVVGLGLLGGLAGLGIAAAAGTSLGAGFGIGALVGGIAGAIAGPLVGYHLERTSRVGPDEADELIQGRYGEHLREALAEGRTLGRSVILQVNEAEMCAAYVAAYPDEEGAAERCKHLEGWVAPGGPPKRVFVRADRNDPGVFVHEGLHVHGDERFGHYLRPVVAEGTTEYFTRQILHNARIPRSGFYEWEVEEVRRLVEVVGEEPLARAYFEGDIAALEGALARARGRDARWGHCALWDWAINLQIRHTSTAREILAGRHAPDCPAGEEE